MKSSPRIYPAGYCFLIKQPCKSRVNLRSAAEPPRRIFRFAENVAGVSKISLVSA